MATADDGIAAIAYAPSEVKTFIKNKIPLSIIEETEYPFRGKINLTVNPQTAVKFPLVLHIPAWARRAQIKINEQIQNGIAADSFYRINRTWKAGDKVEIDFPLEIRTSSWFNNSAAVERGPLIFSLKIGENFSVTKARMNNPAPPEAKDYEIKPATAWNYGLSFSNGGIEKRPKLSTNRSAIILLRQTARPSSFEL